MDGSGTMFEGENIFSLVEKLFAGFILLFNVLSTVFSF